MYLGALELFVQLIVIVGVVTQVIIPLIYDRPLFPIFSWKWTKARHELRDAMDEIEYDKFKQKLDEVKPPTKESEK